MGKNLCDFMLGPAAGLIPLGFPVIIAAIGIFGFII
jgi:hypothetical protein